MAIACSAAQAVETGEHSGIKRKNTEIKSKKGKTTNLCISTIAIKIMLDSFVIYFFINSGNKSTTAKRNRDIVEVVANLDP